MVRPARRAPQGDEIRAQRLGLATGRLLGLTLAAAFSLAGCSDGEPTGSSSTTSSGSSTIRSAPPEAPEDRDGFTVTVTPSTSPTWDRRSSTSAQGVANKAMRLYVRRDLPARDWMARLEPYLSPAAAQAYQGTDPAAGEPIKITGRPRLLEGGSAYLAKVHLSTNQGTYLVLLSRESTDASWRVERFTPPENVGS